MMFTLALNLYISNIQKSMPPKIKLEVNHGKHKKNQKQSGAKLTLPQKPKEQQPSNKQKSPQLPKTKQPDNKSPKQSKQNANKNSKNKNSVEEQTLTNGKNLKDGKQKQKVGDRQLETIQRIKLHQDKTKKTIEQLIDQYKSAADDIFTNHGHNPEKQKVIQVKLQKLQKQHKQRLNKLKQAEEKAFERSQNKTIKKQQKQENRQLKLKQKRKKKAENKLDQLRALSNDRLQRQAKYQQYFHNQYKAKIPRFKKYQEQYKLQQQAQQDSFKQKLRQIKRRYAPMNIEEIEQFEEKYEENKWNLIQQREKRRQEELQMIQKENEELKAKLWRGQCHRRVQEEEKQKNRVKNQGKTKLEKTKNYGTIIKQSFKPKIDPQHRKMSLSISEVTKNNGLLNEDEDEQYKSVARQKYFQGHNRGLVIEKLRKSLQIAEKNKKGNSYLQYVVNMPKNRTDGSQSARLQQKQPQQTPYIPKKVPSTTFKPKRQKNPYYNNSYSDKLPSKASIKNPQTYQFMVAQMKGKQQQIQLQQKAIKYGRYNGILQLQNRHNDLNKKIIQSISDKLQILSKI